MVFGAFSSSLWLFIAVGGFQSSLFRLHAVPSGVRCGTDRLLCCLIVSISLWNVNSIIPVDVAILSYRLHWMFVNMSPAGDQNLRFRDVILSIPALKHHTHKLNLSRGGMYVWDIYHFALLRQSPREGNQISEELKDTARAHKAHR